jgi:hypothetical protein
MREGSPDDKLRVQTLFPLMVHAWKVMAQPLTPAERQEAAALIPHLPLTGAPAAAGLRGLAALKMYYIAFVVIFARPIEVRPHAYEDMLADAITAASAPHALLTLLGQLLAKNTSCPRTTRRPRR